MTEQETRAYQRQTADDEIDLVDLFLILWKRKWLIVIVTLLVTIVAAGISMIMPKVYEITAILEPASDAEGKLVENPQAVKETITGGAYDLKIASSIGLPLEKIPKFKVSVPKDTDLVKISVESQEPEQAVQIVNEVLNSVSDDIQEELDLKIKETRNRIKTAELEEKLLQNQIILVRNQISAIQSKVAELEGERSQAMRNPQGEAMAVLLYSNEIQNQQIYLNKLQEKLANFENQKEQIAIKIDNIQLEMERIKGTYINKAPSVPENPIKPKKTLIVALAFVLGFMGSIMLAFIAEFMNKVRQQQKNQEEA